MLPWFVSSNPCKTLMKTYGISSLEGLTEWTQVFVSYLKPYTASKDACVHCFSVIIDEEYYSQRDSFYSPANKV